MIETDHLGAAMNAVYSIPPPPNGPGTNNADFAGWGGDLTTFWGEYRLSDEDNAYKFCMENLGKATVATTFKLLDFLEDADGFNIGQELRLNPTKTIYQAVREYYGPGGGYMRRFSLFYNSRFAGDTRLAKNITRNMLVDESSLTITELRAATVRSVAWPDKLYELPILVPGSFWVKKEELNGFIDGFYSVLRDLSANIGISCSG
jgi:hypothetical protein